MINPDLERRYADCLELVEAWRLFLDIINRGLKTPGPIPPQLEQQFLNTKARIAMLHDSFVASLRHDKQVGANMLEIVNRAITLRLLRKMSEAEAKKTEIEWHEVFLLLNETVSTLNEERTELANVNEVSFKLGKMRESLVANLKTFFGSFYFKISAAVGVVVFILVGIPALGIYDYDDLRDVPQAKPVVKLWLDATRETLGVDNAYFDMESFMQKAETKKHAFMTQVIRKTNDYSRERGTSIVTGPNMFSSPDLAKELEDAKDYGAYDYIRESVTDGGTARVYAFWFRKKRDAKEAEAAARRVTAPTGVQVVRKANVVCFIQTRDAGFLDDVMRYGIGYLAP